MIYKAYKYFINQYYSPMIYENPDSQSPTVDIMQRLGESDKYPRGDREDRPRPY